MDSDTVVIGGSVAAGEMVVGKLAGGSTAVVFPVRTSALDRQRRGVEGVENEFSSGRESESARGAREIDGRPGTRTAPFRWDGR